MIFRGGLTITTTLDPNAQNVAQAEVGCGCRRQPGQVGRVPSSRCSRTPARSSTWPRTPCSCPPTASSIRRSELQRGQAGQGRQRPQRHGRVPARLHHEAVHVRGMAQRGQVHEHDRQRVPCVSIRRTSPGRTPVRTPPSAAYDAQEFPAPLMTCRTPSEGYYRTMTVLYGLDNSINTVTFASAAQVDLCGIQKIVDAVGHPRRPAPADDTGKSASPAEDQHDHPGQPARFHADRRR